MMGGEFIGRLGGVLLSAGEWGLWMHESVSPLHSAVDHKGPPSHSSPRSPLRMVMSVLATIKIHPTDKHRARPYRRCE